MVHKLFADDLPTGTEQDEEKAEDFDLEEPEEVEAKDEIEEDGETE